MNIEREKMEGDVEISSRLEMTGMFTGHVTV